MLVCLWMALISLIAIVIEEFSGEIRKKEGQHMLALFFVKNSAHHPWTLKKNHEPIRAIRRLADHAATNGGSIEIAPKTAKMA